MKPYFWVIIILLILAVGLGGWFYWKNFSAQKQNPTQTSNQNKQSNWQEKGVAIAGTFADADVVVLGDGRYRMYYAVEPEVAGNNLEIYSSISSDGINWTKEDGTRKSMATFADVIKLPDNKWRMYFQNAGEIKSASSDDGLSWQDEPGIRIDKNETGYNLDNVGAQSTIQLSDETYIMVYRGLIDRPYETSEQIPNKTTQIYFWATSKDGLSFEKKGLAIDSRDDNLLGLADGADWVKWPIDEYRVYFWSYAGIYHATFENNKFSAPIFDFTNNKDKNVKFAPDPPCDPTIIKIDNQWFMFYGQHTKGIYYAILEE